MAKFQMIKCQMDKCLLAQCLWPNGFVPKDVAPLIRQAWNLSIHFGRCFKIRDRIHKNSYKLLTINTWVRGAFNNKLNTGLLSWLFVVEAKQS